MINIDVSQMGYKDINDAIRGEKECTLLNCIGQRFIADSMSDKKVNINGIPGNALGAYLNGAVIEVNGNAQDAVGDTMNDGSIIVHGDIGDAAGYAMRGGKIFVKGNAGYRAGIHMKAYKDKKPVMVIGGKVGSFLGEYQAGGVIIVLGLTDGDRKIVGDYPSTGMHGGKIFIRSDCKDIKFSHDVIVKKATADELKEIEGALDEFCAYFDYDKNELLSSDYTVVTPNSKNPYKQMYVAN